MRDYATITLQSDPVPNSNLIGSAAIVLGVAAGLGIILLGATSPAAAQLYSATARAPVTTVYQSTIIPPTHASRPLYAVGTMQAEIGQHSQEHRVLATPLKQVSTAWTSAAAFLAGCVFAVVGLAHQLRAKPQHVEPFSMMGVAPAIDTKEIPSHFGKDTDPGCLRRRFESMLRKGQEKICAAIEKCDGEGKFVTDAWVREGGGGGISRVLANGKVWEKAGIGLSVIYGNMPSETINAARARQANYAKDLPAGEKVPFFACGLSCVMHPRNPHCPTMHFNYRYFETEAGDWWFAGGTDITPAYLDVEDMKHFHGVYKKVCDKHDPQFYEKYKKWADEYFLIRHRGETRGLGGIFYDDLNDRDPMTIFSFSEECLDNVVPAYVPIIEKHKNDPFTPEQKRWQLIRRGRYVEFNLVYDRGTIFGLKTGLGRMETIMMTLPEFARWEYDHHPEPGSEEEKVMEAFKNPRDWV